MLTELVYCKLDLVGVQEVNWGTGGIELADNYTFFYTHTKKRKKKEKRKKRKRKEKKKKNMIFWMGSFHIR
jgi:predicted acyl esterase